MPEALDFEEDSTWDVECITKTWRHNLILKKTMLSYHLLMTRKSYWYIMNIIVPVRKHHCSISALLWFHINVELFFLYAKIDYVTRRGSVKFAISSANIMK